MFSFMFSSPLALRSFAENARAVHVRRQHSRQIRSRGDFERVLVEDDKVRHRPSPQRSEQTSRPARARGPRGVRLERSTRRQRLRRVPRASGVARVRFVPRDSRAHRRERVRVRDDGPVRAERQRDARPDERPKRVPAVSSALRSEPTGSRERVQKHVRRLHRRQRAHVREPLGFAFDRRRQVLRVLDAEPNGAAVVVFRDGAVRGRGALGGARGGGDAYGVRRYLRPRRPRALRTRRRRRRVRPRSPGRPRTVPGTTRFERPTSRRGKLYSRRRGSGKANRRRRRFYRPRRIRASRDRARVPSPRAARRR